MAESKARQTKKTVEQTGVDLAELVEALRQNSRRVSVEFHGLVFEIEYNPGIIPDETRVQLSVSGQVTYQQISTLVHNSLLDWTLTRGGKKLPLSEFGKLPGEVVEAIGIAIVNDLRPNPETPAS